MKKSKFTEAQIAFALKQAGTGTRVDKICRKMGISAATFLALIVRALNDVENPQNEKNLQIIDLQAFKLFVFLTSGEREIRTLGTV